MSKEMIISVNGREKKIAIVEDDVVTEFYVERGDENQGIVGNIYKGRVMKVLPGMQSAFVDIGLERDSFLYVSDFFDEEEEEEIEDKKETQRQIQKQQPRAQREGLRIAIPVEQEPEEEKDFELRMAALRHIEEISEEPAPEPPPEEEELETGLTEAAEDGEVSLSPRQRRQRRLRYTDKEAKAVKVAPATEIPETEAATEAVADAGSVAETEEEYSGRRPRRRPRRRRGAEAAEPGPEAAKGDEESAPYIIVHHEPLERITDDDTAVTEGEMLKDALLQERISERIHEEERRASLLEVEPTPEVLVGSLRRSIASEMGFERISDDSEARADAEPKAELDVESNYQSGVEPREAPGAESNSELDIEVGKIEPISEWAPTVFETLIEEPDGARIDSEPLEIDED